MINYFSVHVHVVKMTILSVELMIMSFLIHEEYENNITALFKSMRQLSAKLHGSKIL